MPRNNLTAEERHQLKLATTRKWAADRRAKGLCKSCPNTTEGGKALCSTCQANRTRSRKIKYIGEQFRECRSDEARRLIMGTSK